MKKPPRAWHTTIERLRHVVFTRGVDAVADAIPADRSTVYRILSRPTHRPVLAIRVRIEKLTDKETQ